MSRNRASPLAPYEAFLANHGQALRRVHGVVSVNAGFSDDHEPALQVLVSRSAVGFGHVERALMLREPDAYRPFLALQNVDLKIA